MFRAARAADTEEYRQAVRVGKAATKKGRADRKAGGATRSSVFGVVGKQLKQHALKQQIAVHRQSLAPCDPTTAAFAMGARAVQAGLSMKECLQIARSVIKDASSLAAQQAEDDFEALQKYRSTVGAASAAQLCEDLPELSQFELVPHASAACPVFRVAPPSGSDVTSAVSFAHNESNSTNLSSRLADSW